MVTLTLEGLRDTVNVGPEPELHIRGDGIYVPTGRKLAAFANGFWIRNDQFYTGGRADGPMRVTGCDADMRPIAERIVEKLRLASGTLYADGKVVWEVGQAPGDGQDRPDGSAWHAIKLSAPIGGATR
jgi:hypothetical protein